MDITIYGWSTRHDPGVSLPLLYLIFWQMRFFDDMTQTHIAQKLGISQMHVSRLLARSLKQLRAGFVARGPRP
jgi:DNA-binding transcriptional regulator LsrR (DeoR family)